MPQYLLIEKIDIYPFEINVNRPALLETRQRAHGVSRGGLGAEDFTIRQRLLFPDAIELVGSAQQ